MPPEVCDHTDIYGSTIMEGGPYSKHPGVLMCIICDEPGPFLAVAVGAKTFGDVINAFEDAGVDQRDAYWGHPHRESDGDLELVLVKDGVEHHVVSVAKEPGRIVVVIA